MNSRILIVDDDGLVRSFLVRVLEEHGHLVEQAASGGEALGKLVKEGIICRIPRKGKDTLYCLKMPFDEALEQSKTLK